MVRFHPLPQTQIYTIMNTQTTKHEFRVKSYVSYENSFGTIAEEDSVLLHVTIGINSDTYGWYEIYDVESSGTDWYAEGGLWISEMTVTDYDGMFSLPEFICNKLEELGYNVDDVRC